MIWKSKTKGEDKIIAYVNNTIYKGNPKDEQLENVVHELKTQQTVPVCLTGIPLSYLKEINAEEGRDYIEVSFGRESTEHLRIKDENRRKEIFEFLKENIPNSINYVDHYSKVRAGKKPLIAMGFILPIFLWTYYIANQIEMGYQYEVSGGHYNSLAGLVLGLASLGVLKIMLIFGALFAIAVFGFIQKTRNPKVIHTIKMVRGFI